MRCVTAASERGAVLVRFCSCCCFCRAEHRGRELHTCGPACFCVSHSFRSPWSDFQAGASDSRGSRSSSASWASAIYDNGARKKPFSVGPRAYVPLSARIRQLRRSGDSCHAHARLPDAIRRHVTRGREAAAAAARVAGSPRVPLLSAVACALASSTVATNGTGVEQL